MGRKAVEVVDGKLTCTKCKETKLVSEFYTSPQRHCGYASNCKECSAACSRKIYHKDPAKAYERTAQWRVENPERNKEIMRNRYWNNPLKSKARSAMAQAIKYGKLTRQPCEVCGDVNSEGHHWSYKEEHWLDVKWLCLKHHAEEHLRLRELEREQKTI